MEEIKRVAEVINKCLICGKPVPDYEPDYCCDGYMCGCQGMPMTPCCCSMKCEDAVFNYIGLPYEERRKKAGIEKWIAR